MSAVATDTAARTRELFPILKQKIGDHPVVYLDSAATGQKPESVISAIADFYRNDNAPIHRSTYSIAERATEGFESARRTVAEYMNADESETIFTRNATESINLVAQVWGRENLGPGDVVLSTLMEHHSNIVPWQLVCQATGARIEYVDVTEDGLLDEDDLDRRLAAGDVKLFVACHISNVLGTINDPAALAEKAHAAGARILIDGSQAVPQLPVDFAASGADFYAWTGHKVYGPTGIGVLHGRRELLEAMGPWLGGGDMIKVVSEASSTWNDLPWKFEAGTSAVAQAVGLAAAVEFVMDVGIDNIHAHEQQLVAYAMPRLAEIPGITVVGPAADQRGGVISFTLDGMHPHDIGELLGREGVCVRTGHHCAQPLMRKLGIPATARASFACFNNTSDVDALVGAIVKAREVFKL